MNGMETNIGFVYLPLIFNDSYSLFYAIYSALTSLNKFLTTKHKEPDDTHEASDDRAKTARHLTAGQ